MRLLILDDHSLFSEGLCKILKESYANLHHDSFQSISELNKLKTDYSLYDLIISDIELPGENVFELLEELKKNLPKLPILIISMHNKLSVIKKCKDLKIDGYILKDEFELVSPAIKSLLSGEEFYSKKVIQTLNILNKKDKVLTPQEERIIALVAKGNSNQEIADELFISYNTIKTHRKNINRKLEIASTSELMKYYFENYIP